MAIGRSIKIDNPTKNKPGRTKRSLELCILRTSSLSGTNVRNAAARITKTALLAALTVSSTFICIDSSAAEARQLLRERFSKRYNELRKTSGNVLLSNIAGLQVAIWEPKEAVNSSPLVIFSHGFKGGNKQSAVTMQALADAGYYVFAPNHKDSMANGNMSARPQVPFTKASKWNESTYQDRGDDVKKLLAAIQNDPAWQQKIDFSKVALMGHSLGGYTVLGLAGAWPTWKIDGIKAVIALSPYATPYVQADSLKGVDVPIMYQCGTMDFGVSPFLLGANGAFAKSNSPTYLVDIKGANHFTWTVLNRQKEREELIDYYCIAFLNKYVRQDAQAKPEERLPGLAELLVK